MGWWVAIGFGPCGPDDDDRIRAQLAEQERRVQALDRALEVIQRRLEIEHPDVAE